MGTTGILGTKEMKKKRREREREREREKKGNNKNKIKDFLRIDGHSHFRQTKSRSFITANTE